MRLQVRLPCCSSSVTHGWSACGCKQARARAPSPVHAVHAVHATWRGSAACSVPAPGCAPCVPACSWSPREGRRGQHSAGSTSHRCSPLRGPFLVCRWARLAGWRRNCSEKSARRLQQVGVLLRLLQMLRKSHHARVPPPVAAGAVPPCQLNLILPPPPAADIFSLGCLLYLMCTLRPLFASRADVEAAALRWGPSDAAEAAAALSPAYTAELQGLLQTMLQARAGSLRRRCCRRRNRMTLFRATTVGYWLPEPTSPRLALHRAILKRSPLRCQY